MKKKEKISNKDGLYSSEFAELYGISKDTLLYYDRIGLFQPQIRSENGYRLYSLDQLHQFDLLLMLRATNMPLEKIRSCLKDYHPQQILSLLKEQTKVISKEISSLQNLQQKMSATADMIEYGLKAEYNIPHTDHLEESYFVALESTPEMVSDRYMRMAFVRRHLQYCQKHGLPCDFLRSGIIKQEHLEKNNFVKDYFCIRTATRHPDAQVIVQPQGLYALIEHKGSYETIDRAYLSLKTYIAANGFRITGNAYETELLGYATFQNSEDYVIQIAIQIEKA